jgi:1-acyl-sn-glycerol-3-phosphate acyltransferase
VVPLIIARYVFDAHHSIDTTQYIFGGILAFFFLVIGIIAPYTRKIMHFLGIPDHANKIDGLWTVLLIVVSGPFILILSIVTLLLLRTRRLQKHRYKIFNFAVQVAVFLLGARTKHHGGRDPLAKIVIANHTSPLDYLLISLYMGTNPWNVVAGRNLSDNKPKITKEELKKLKLKKKILARITMIGDWLISISIGKLVKDYAISVDRKSKVSRESTVRRMMEELERGTDVAIFPEGTRTPKNKIKEGHILLQEFQRGAFKTAWDKQVPIQPLVFDWPVQWRGKGDDWWGIHPCRIDIYFLSSITPADFETIEDFTNACWNSMFTQLEKSKKVQEFLKPTS